MQIQLPPKQEQVILPQLITHPNPSTPIQKVPKPSTPYMIFMKKYKSQMKEGQKFNLKLIAQIWNSFDQKQKDVYAKIQKQQKQKYDQYLKQCAINGIVLDDKRKVNLEFPTTRIKNIMKQDKAVKCKVNTVIYMNKAVELFGVHIMETIKRNIGAKKKLELGDLWQAINIDRTLGFLQPVIDDYSNTHAEKSLNKKRISLQVQKEKPQQNEKEDKPLKQTPAAYSSSKTKPSGKKISSAQPTLNDLWK